MVDQSDTLLFVHVPKTAGTTLRVVMARQYLGQRVFTIGHDIEADRQRLGAMREQEKRRLRAVFGHMAWGWHEQLAPDQPYAYITMLREPVERVLSLWAHCQLSEHYLGAAVKGMNLTNFITSGVTRRADNAMVRQLCGEDQFINQAPYNDMIIPLGGVTQAHLDAAKENIGSCSVVGVAEQFPQFIKTMNRRYAWRVASWRNENVTRWPRLKRANLDRKTLAVVEAATALDRELYEEALRIVGGQK
jgi:hypothetical protein